MVAALLFSVRMAGLGPGNSERLTVLRTSVANWPNFRPHNSKGAVKKYVRPKKLAADFLSNIR
jgi:hypothetical protein